jgi:hypothetical protein
MKKLIIICIITLTLAVSPNIALAVPVTDDLWDDSQGITITASSPILSGSDAGNIFGTNYGWLDAGTTLFDDFKPIGTELWVQWQTTAAVALGSFKLYAAHDGEPNAAKSFDYFSLFAKGLGTDGVFTLIYETAIDVPYEFIDGESTFTFSGTVTH